MDGPIISSINKTTSGRNCLIHIFLIFVVLLRRAFCRSLSDCCKIFGRLPIHDTVLHFILLESGTEGTRNRGSVDRKTLYEALRTRWESKWYYRESMFICGAAQSRMNAASTTETYANWFPFVVTHSFQRVRYTRYTILSSARATGPS